MSLTLSSELLAVQKNQDRNPICRITSSKIDASIPFIGNYFSTEEIDEQYPSMIETSEGRLSLTIASDSTNLVYKYSDKDKTEWNNITVITGSQTILESALLELPNGNIAIIYIDKNGSTSYRIRSLIISDVGVIITPVSTVLTYVLADYTIGGIAAIQLPDNSYYATFTKYTVATEEYDICYITSSDWSSWSIENIITLTGLISTRVKGNTSLVVNQDDEVMLFFDYVNYISGGTEIKNIFYCVSTDNGETYNTPIQVTDIALLGQQNLHPSVDIDSNGKITVAYSYYTNVLNMDINTEFWCGSSLPTDIHYDVVGGKLYILNIYYSGGTKALRSVVVVDIATWTIEKCYNTTSSPAYNEIFLNDHVVRNRHFGHGHYVCAATNTNVLLIDHSSETIKEYHAADNITYGCQKNINFPDPIGRLSPQLRGTWVDADSKKLYLVFFDDYVQTYAVWFGYIDLTEVADPSTGYYSYHALIADSFQNFPGAWFVNMKDFLVIPELNYLVVSFGGLSGSPGSMKIYDYETGSIVKYYYPSKDGGFPWNAPSYLCYYDGYLYGSIIYTTTNQEEDRKGLMSLEIATDIFQYIAPSTSTRDDYGLGQKVVTDDDRLIIASGYGIHTYDILTGAWTIINNSNTPGLTEDGMDIIGDVDYDPINNFIFASATPSALNYWNGVMMFNEDGPLKQVRYRTAETPLFEFSSESDFIRGYSDYETAIVISSDDDLWSSWTKDSDGSLSLKWDHEDASILLHNYLTGNVTAKWEIDQRNSLSFSLSHGHLFDPSNLQSILSVGVEKGRKIKLEFGELISGTEYYQDQGFFFVKETSLSYSRGDHPVINVTCEDITTMWDDAKIVATDYYSEENPENIISDLITSFGNLTTLEMDIPDAGEMEKSHLITHQWLDSTLNDCLKSLLDHFGYTQYMDVTGKYSIKKVDIGADVSNEYDDTTLLTNYTPDDSYSSFTNQVIVRGEGQYFVEVTYSEESVASLAGTLGWWGCSETKRIYYSDDKKKKCRDPSLVISENPSINMFFVRKGGGSIKIKSIDTYELYVDVTIVAPDLIVAFAAAVATMLAIGAASTECIVGCGFYIYALSISISVVTYILASTANYSFEVYAKPVGSEKQTFQGKADDLEFQRKIGMVVSEDIDDPFCYTVTKCLDVAEYELGIVMAQRKRRKFQKITSLQDEICDVIKIPHPYTLLPNSILITTLTRTYSKPEGLSNGSGGLIDSIEGWNV